MATDFFVQQDRARQNTSLLLFYFALALMSLIALTYAFFESIHYFSLSEKELRSHSVWNPLLFGATAVGVTVVVGLGSLFKILELASGGRTVALMLGGRELVGETRSASERRLLNVVEEMSLASGVPVPPVFVLPGEGGINAFAAGHSIGNAVVAVSQGALERLNRDELQGVVAHEFSHILNGDMRLNIRLIGVIFGIIGLSQIGYILLRVGAEARKNGAWLVSVGAGLWLLGAGGALFGRLIQSAVSRQREFLADASAVQFTRNPDGIVGALKKIGGMAGSAIRHPSANEISHMFFSDAFRGRRFVDLFATHPPLGERILRLDPHFDGVYPKVEEVNEGESDEPRAAKPKRKSAFPAFPALEQLPLPVTAALMPEDAVDHVGQVDEKEMASAHLLQAEMPENLKAAAHELMAARAVVFGLLLDADPAVRAKQLAALHDDPAGRAQLEAMLPALASLPAAMHLPLADMALPALRQLSKPQYDDFHRRVKELMDADGKISLFEYALHSVVTKYLNAEFRPAPSKIAYFSRAALTPKVQVVISMLAWKGQSDPARVNVAYAAGLREFAPKGIDLPILAAEQCKLGAFDAALRELARALPAIRRTVIAASAACILADGVVTIREFELLRAISALLDCPMPPLPLAG